MPKNCFYWGYILKFIILSFLSLMLVSGPISVDAARNNNNRSTVENMSKVSTEGVNAQEKKRNVCCYYACNGGKTCACYEGDKYGCSGCLNVICKGSSNSENGVFENNY